MSAPPEREVLEFIPCWWWRWCCLMDGCHDCARHAFPHLLVVFLSAMRTPTSYRVYGCSRCEKKNSNRDAYFESNSPRIAACEEGSTQPPQARPHSEHTTVIVRCDLLLLLSRSRTCCCLWCSVVWVRGLFVFYYLGKFECWNFPCIFPQLWKRGHDGSPILGVIRCR